MVIEGGHTMHDPNEDPEFARAVKRQRFLDAIVEAVAVSMNVRHSNTPREDLITALYQAVEALNALQPLGNEEQDNGGSDQALVLSRVRRLETLAQEKAGQRLQKNETTGRFEIRV